MYATCLFCNNALGRNEAVESFPVGQRLAFDQAKGRLWVVCARCERWNLTPLEERWEAIEQAERLYRDARRRVATDNVGLAQQYERYAEKAAALGLVKKEDADLDRYVTQKALDGLFLTVAEEEKKIRKDPLAAGSSIVRKVFGALL